MNKKEPFTNCHRTSGRKKEAANNIPNASEDSDQDSSTTKYVVEKDDRERKDGPGGD